MPVAPLGPSLLARFAAGGPAVPLDWMAQFPATNGYLAGIVRNLPVGYSYDNVKLVTDLANC